MDAFSLVKYVKASKFVCVIAVSKGYTSKILDKDVNIRSLFNSKGNTVWCQVLGCLITT